MVELPPDGAAMELPPDGASHPRAQPGDATMPFQDPTEDKLSALSPSGRRRQLELKLGLTDFCEVFEGNEGRQTLPERPACTATWPALTV